jgi:hypothetical protein
MPVVSALSVTITFLECHAYKLALFEYLGFSQLTDDAGPISLASAARLRARRCGC